MSEPSTFQAITVIAGLIGAIGGAFAAAAAFYSANNARRSEERAASIEQRSLTHSVEILAHEILAETISASQIANQLKISLKELAAHSGASGGSRLRVLTDEADTTKTELVEMQKEARAWIEQNEPLHKTSKKNLEHNSIRFKTLLIQVNRIKRKLESDLSTVDSDNRIYREKVIKNR